MNWDALGALAELVGAAAVVITLIYLSSQLKQNTRSLNSNNSNNVMQGFNQVNAALFTNADAARILYTGLDAPDALTTVEQHQFAHLLASIMNIYRNLYHQHLDGTFPESSWLPWASEAKQLLESPGGVFFLSRSATYEDLAAHVRALSVPEAKPLSWPSHGPDASTEGDPA